jgi:SAM-dependent methyltransferase
MPEPEFQLEFEPVAQCPLCGAAGKSPRIQPPMIGGGAASFATCAECGLAYLDPAPTPAALARFYASQYLTVDYRKIEGFFIPDPRRELAGTLGYMERLADDVETYRMPPGRILDAGCAYGGFLLEMHMRGWDATGVEPFADAAAFCRDQLGLRVALGEIETLEFADGSFDAITLWDVIEHLPRPVKAMQALARMAAPGALLMLTTPNVNSPAALLSRESWIGWKPPTHLCLFDFTTMRRLLGATGWTLLAARGGGIYPGQLTVTAQKQQA